MNILLIFSYHNLDQAEMEGGATQQGTLSVDVFPVQNFMLIQKLFGKSA